MHILLTAEEARVLGALMEKEVSTPDHYPLSLNALTNACNQTTSRDPIVRYDEDTVVRALDSLRGKKLLREVDQASGRVRKYQQQFSIWHDLDSQAHGERRVARPQPFEHGLDFRQIAKLGEPIGARFQLARGLRAAQQ